MQVTKAIRKQHLEGVWVASSQQLTKLANLIKLVIWLTADYILIIAVQTNNVNGRSYVTTYIIKVAGFRVQIIGMAAPNLGKNNGSILFQMGTMLLQEFNDHNYNSSTIGEFVNCYFSFRTLALTIVERPNF